MKTKAHSHAGLASRPEQLGTGGEAPDSRSPLDFARRQVNRHLPTPDLLELLRTEAPALLERAEVVGSWVWIQFPDRQPPAVTRQLAELGFHWNHRRQTWQHPCGNVTEGTPLDPRTKYGSRPAAQA